MRKKVAGLVILVGMFSLTTANAAPSVSAPLAINLYSAGSPEAGFSSLTATPTGWILVGTAAAEVVGGSWSLPPAIGGDDVLIVAVDLNGRPQWATRAGTSDDDAGLLVTTDTAGAIWSVGVSSLMPAGAMATPTIAVNPDSVPEISDDEGSNGPNQLLVSLLSPTGTVMSETTIAAPAGNAIQPVKMFATASGVVVVGSVAADETGATRGFIAKVDNQMQVSMSFIGTNSTSIADAENTPSGIQIAGASSEALGKKMPIGLRDAFTATWSNETLSSVIRSGSKGVDRIWNSLTATKDGFLLVGWSDTSGKIETIATSLTKSGKVIFSNRYPASDEQFVFSENRLVLATKTASALVPGWKPSGVDIVILTLDPKGKSLGVMSVAGPGNEELLAVSAKAILGRTSAGVPKAQGQGTIFLARIAR